MWPPKELGYTVEARASKNTTHLYLKKDGEYCFMVVDYMEINEYLDKGFKRTPMECDEEDEKNMSLPPKTDDLKVKIDRLEAKIKEKEKNFLKINKVSD